MKLLHNKIGRKAFAVLAVVFLSTSMLVNAAEVLKRDTVFAIENMDAKPFPLGVFSVNSNGTVTRQDTLSIPTTQSSAVGLAVSTKNKLIFASHESFSSAAGIVDVIDGETGTAYPSLTIPGTSNIAGIVVSEGRNRFYAVNRGSTNVFVYDMKSDGTVTRMQGEEFNTVAGVYGIDVWEDKLYCTHGYSRNNKVTIYDLNTKQLVKEYTTTQASNMAIAVDGSNSSNVLVYTTWTSQYTSSNTVTQYNVNTDEEKFIVLGRDGRGLSVNPALGVMYAVTGDNSDSTPTELRTYGKGQFTTAADNSPAPLGSVPLSGNPTDVVAVGITFDPELTIEITDPQDQIVSMCNYVTFTVTVQNTSPDQDLIIDGMENNYDASVMSFISSTGPTPDDTQDDGKIEWSNLNHTIAASSSDPFTLKFLALKEANTVAENMKVTDAAYEDGTPAIFENTIYFDIAYSEDECPGTGTPPVVTPPVVTPPEECVDCSVTPPPVEKPPVVTPPPGVTPPDVMPPLEKPPVVCCEPALKKRESGSAVGTLGSILFGLFILFMGSTMMRREGRKQ